MYYQEVDKKLTEKQKKKDWRGTESCGTLELKRKESEIEPSQQKKLIFKSLEKGGRGGILDDKGLPLGVFIALDI